MMIWNIMLKEGKWGTWNREQRILNSVSHLLVVLVTEPGSLARAVRNLNCCSIYPTSVSNINPFNFVYNYHSWGSMFVVKGQLSGIFPSTRLDLGTEFRSSVLPLIPFTCWGIMLAHAVILSGLTLFKFCEGKHNFYEFICAISILCSEDEHFIIPLPIKCCIFPVAS